MPSKNEAHEALRKLVRRRSAVELEALYGALGTRSRMTVFRRLREIGYMSSFTHGGRYYTLADVPKFDDAGLWHYQGIGFSRFGTLKSTVEHLVVASDDGRTHEELSRRLELRVHNTLLDLVLAGRIARATVGGLYLYVSPDPVRAEAQGRSREQRGIAGAGAPRPPIPSVEIEVLLEVIRGAGVRVDADAVATRLDGRGVVVTGEQVREVLRRHELEKKTAPSPSRRSPR